MFKCGASRRTAVKGKNLTGAGGKSGDWAGDGGGKWEDVGRWDVGRGKRKGKRKGKGKGSKKTPQMDVQGKMCQSVMREGNDIRISMMHP